MPKYKPESRRKIERDVKDIKHRAKDRIKHMNNVKKDAKAMADVSKKIKQESTIEAGKAIKEALWQSGEIIRREFAHWQIALKDISREVHRKENEFKDRIKYSKLNYAELTKASNSIKETPAAKRGLDQGRLATQKDLDIMKAVESTLRGIRQHIQDMSYELESTKDLGILLGERDGKSDWAEFSLNPQEVKDVLEEHQMDIELRGPVLAKDRGKSERIK